MIFGYCIRKDCLIGYVRDGFLYDVLLVKWNVGKCRGKYLFGKDLMGC